MYDQQPPWDCASGQCQSLVETIAMIAEPAASPARVLLRSQNRNRIDRTGTGQYVEDMVEHILCQRLDRRKIEMTPQSALALCRRLDRHNGVPAAHRKRSASSRAAAATRVRSSSVLITVSHWE